MDKKLNMPGITLGSLFDGIGGFPYAGSFFGIKPLWASEIMPQAISVTQKHLPDMAHVGDITVLDGAKLPPVDIIAFGSPCQGLSTAGRRLGLADERSGLFSEAIRIIDEMRRETNGKYPRYAVWENVPGALSSGNPRGSDFHAVLESFAKTEIPIPRSGSWANAGMVRGEGVDLAWSVYNAQYFGVPQRRRRVFLVCDFGSRSAAEILFIPKSLSGYFAACRAQGQIPAADVVRGADGASLSANLNDTAATIFAGYGNHWNGNAGAYDGGNFALSPSSEEGGVGFDGYNGDLTGDQAATLGVNCGMSTGRNGVIQPNCLTPWDTQQSRVFTEDGTSPTLTGADGGGGRNPGGLVIQDTEACSVLFEGHGNDARYNGPLKVAPTLSASYGMGGGNIPLAINHYHNDSAVLPAAFMGDSSSSSNDIEYMEEMSPTLKPRLSGTPCLCEQKTEEPPQAAVFLGGAGAKARSIGYSEQTSPTLKGEPCGFNAPCVCEKRTAAFMANAGSKARSIGYGEEISPTLKSDLSPCVCEQKACIVVNDQGGDSLNIEKTEISPTLRSETHGNLPIVAVSEAYPISTQIATRHKSLGEGTGFGVGNDGDPAYTLQQAHSHAVAVGVHQGQSGDVNISPTAYTLTTSSGASARNAPLVCENLKAFSLDSDGSNSMKSSNPHSGCREVEIARTLDTTNPCPSKNQGGVAVVSVHPDVSGTLMASGAGLSRPAGMASETDLCVAYCLQGNMIGRQDHNGPRGNGINEDVSFTLNTIDQHCIAATFNRQRSDLFQQGDIASTQTARQCKDATDLVCICQTTGNENDQIDVPSDVCFASSSYGGLKEGGVATLRAEGGDNGGGSENLIVSQTSAHYIVRRLLPIECERLQGYPDGWTKFGHDGKEISDTRRYQMLGNSVAVPCVAYIMLGIAEYFGKEVEETVGG